MHRIISIKADSKEEFTELRNKFQRTIDKWNKRFPNFNYAFIGSSKTLELSIEIEYNKPENEEKTDTESCSQFSERSSQGEGFTNERGLTDSDFSV